MSQSVLIMSTSDQITEVDSLAQACYNIISASKGNWVALACSECQHLLTPTPDSWVIHSTEIKGSALRRNPNAGNYISICTPPTREPGHELATFLPHCPRDSEYMYRNTVWTLLPMSSCTTLHGQGQISAGLSINIAPDHPSM